MQRARSPPSCRFAIEFKARVIRALHRARAGHSLARGLTVGVDHRHGSFFGGGQVDLSLLFLICGNRSPTRVWGLLGWGRVVFEQEESVVWSGRCAGQRAPLVLAQASTCDGGGRSSSPIALTLLAASLALTLGTTSITLAHTLTRPSSALISSHLKSFRRVCANPPSDSLTDSLSLSATAMVSARNRRGSPGLVRGRSPSVGPSRQRTRTSAERGQQARLS